MNWQPKIKNDLTVVVDTDSCRARFRLTGWNTLSALLYDDGSTLVTVHQETDNRSVIRCWHVDAWKPLRWAIGVPAGLGTLVVLYVWWRSRRLTMASRVAGG